MDWTERLKALDVLFGKTGNCAHCGNEFEYRWMKEMNEQMHANKACFSCNFWLEKVRWRNENDPRAVVVEGTHYHIGDEREVAGFRGFGGSKFVIKFHDGREVTSRNLWCQGDIPLLWRSVLTDNAVFVQEHAR